MAMLKKRNRESRSALYISVRDKIIEASNRKLNGQRRWKFELSMLLNLLGREHAFRDKEVALGTLSKRRQLAFQFFNELDAMGVKLPSIYSLRENHVKKLILKWESENLSAPTLQSRYTLLRLLENWLCKPGMIRPLCEYLKKPLAGKRVYVAIRDKSWSTAGIDAIEMIQRAAAIDKYVGCQLKLIFVFGLRRKEAVCFRPHICYDENTGVVQFYQGTKGGRYRVIVVRTEEQKAVLHECRQLVTRHSGYLGDNNKTLKKNLRRFQYVLEKLGVTKKDLGVTAHGLRHQYANDFYEQKTGVPSPVRGGSKEMFALDVTKAAMHSLVEELGHSRLNILTAYVGSSRASTTHAAQERLAESVDQQHSDTSMLDRHLVLIAHCIKAGLGKNEVIVALRAIGEEVSEATFDAWLASLQAKKVDDDHD